MTLIGRLLGVVVGLQIVDDRGAGIKANDGIAGSRVLNGATKVESIAPHRFVAGGATRNESLVVVNEAVPKIGIDSPITDRATELESGETFLTSAMFAKGTGAGEKIDGRSRTKRTWQGDN